MVETPRFFEESARKTVDLAHRNIVHSRLTQGEAYKDREIAHERALNLAEKIQDNRIAMILMANFFTFRDPILKTELGTMIAPNPLGIAGGFDKNARIYRLLGEGLGLGIVTVGSVTKVPYKGNDRPRIFDLPQNDGLINRMGFPGDGTDQAEARLKRDQRPRRYALVINVAASRPSFDRSKQIEDYGQAFQQMLPYGEGIEVNVSSPNTPGVRGLQEPEVFEELASHIASLRRDTPYQNKPLIYKFGPDLSYDKLTKDLQIAIDNGADGVTLTNTSTDQSIRDSLIPEQHSQEAGGMSGALLNSRSLEVTRRAYDFVGETIFIIRAGGVRGTASDLWEALTFGGASAAETYASFVRVPTSTPNYSVYALKELAKAMRAEGMVSMKDFKELRGKKIAFPLRESGR